MAFTVHVAEPAAAGAAELTAVVGAAELYTVTLVAGEVAWLPASSEALAVTVWLLP